jgi:NAD(P)-dependent dehydrogenase (short-subunit alcohol dehydrogenase family)
MKLFDLKNKTAIVTGALGLLGKEHCKALSEAGANVIVCDLDRDNCTKFARKLKTKSIGCYLDVTDEYSIKETRKMIIDEFGHIDVLVNNAAINDMFENPKSSLEKSKFENFPIEMWDKSLSVNLNGVFQCCQIFGGEMVKIKKGSIINIASTYGIVAPNQDLYKKPNGKQSFFKPPAYSATKGAVITFTKYLAAYWGKDGVRVNTLSPGGVENNQDKFFQENYAVRTPLKRMAKPNDYHGAIIYLASDASSYMTGANLVVDGGWTIW